VDGRALQGGGDRFAVRLVCNLLYPSVSVLRTVGISKEFTVILKASILINIMVL